MIINTDEYIDASTAAKIMGVTRATISSHCKNNRFNKAVQVGHFWLIPRDEVESFERHKPGKKPGQVKKTSQLEELLKENERLRELLKEANNENIGKIEDSAE